KDGGCALWLKQSRRANDVPTTPVRPIRAPQSLYALTKALHGNGARERVVGVEGLPRFQRLTHDLTARRLLTRLLALRLALRPTLKANRVLVGLVFEPLLSL